MKANITVICKSCKAELEGYYEDFNWYDLECPVCGILVELDIDYVKRHLDSNGFLPALTEFAKEGLCFPETLEMVITSVEKVEKIIVVRSVYRAKDVCDKFFPICLATAIEVDKDIVKVEKLEWKEIEEWKWDWVWTPTGKAILWKWKKPVTPVIEYAI